MRIVERRARDRGALTHIGAERRLSFSFGDYYNPQHLGFGALRVLNENILAPGAKLPVEHSADVEILSYVSRGRLCCRNSLGDDVIVERDGLLRLSTGEGVSYTFANPSEQEELHFFKIWILTERRGGAQHSIESAKSGRTQPGGGLCLLASADGRNGALKIARDVDVYSASLRKGDVTSHPLGPDREAWLHCVSGEATLGHLRLSSGDGVGVVELDVLKLEATEDAQLLFFDMSRD